MAEQDSTRYEREYDRINAALPGWAHDTSDVPLSDCVKSAFQTLESEVKRLTLERDEARRMTEERSHAFVQYPILLQRLAAMEPWGYDDAGNPLCVFCEVNRYKVVGDGDGRLQENKHERDCLWQNVVNALPTPTGHIISIAGRTLDTPIPLYGKGAVDQNSNG